jgi:hypothetical protein
MEIFSSEALIKLLTGGSSDLPGILKHVTRGVMFGSSVSILIFIASIIIGVIFVVSSK